MKSRTVLKFVVLATASASLTIGLLGTALAQTTAPDVIAKVEAALKGIKDYKLRVTGPAERQLNRLPEGTAAAIVEFMLSALLENPHRLGAVLKLSCGTSSRKS